MHTSSAVLRALNRYCEVPLNLRGAVQVRPTTVYSIYRKANAEALKTALAADAGLGEVHLWALDEPSEVLEAQTRGVGPGPKFDLLNRLLSAWPPARESYVAVLDDDFSWRRGSLGRAVAIADASRLDLAQPTHDRSSFVNHGITVSKPRLRARLTNFVEIGPVFMISPAAQPTLLPFPAETGMGWGLELVWAARCRGRHLMGQLDEVTIQHRTAAGANYSMDDAIQGSRRLLQAEDVNDREPQQTLDRWSTFVRRAPWLVS